MNQPHPEQSRDFGAKRAAALSQEATGWDPSSLTPASPDDIPVVDVEHYFATGDADERERLAEQIRFIGENIGFHCMIGHGIDTEMFESIFSAAEDFLTLPAEIKAEVTIDDPEAAAPGIGWLPLGERRLPERAKGNLNEAVLFKRDRSLQLADNPWLPESDLPGFRAAVEAYAAQIERVAMALLPIYAVALELSPDWFEPAFQSPFYRLRMTRYTDATDAEVDQFGIAPHVDTSFFTLLAQSAPGLAVYSEQRRVWLAAPMIPDALIVNTGELLKQWSNDRFVSVKHFVPPHRGERDRYSVPFFFNATADYPMECLPTCQSPDNPPLYPAVSYLQSQAAAQRE
jgi:isopenicillin N synthase-like dioxygenase